MKEPIYDLELIYHLAGTADQCDDETLRRATQGAFVLQKRLRCCEKALDREIRKRNKEMIAAAAEAEAAKKETT